MFPRTSLIASSMALVLLTSTIVMAGGVPGPRLTPQQYRSDKAAIEARSARQAARYQKNGNFNQHMWSEANKLRAHAAELKARAAEASTAGDKQQLWQKARGLEAKADAMNAQLRAKPGTAAPAASAAPAALPAPARPAGLLPAPAKPAGLLPAPAEKPAAAAPSAAPVAPGAAAVRPARQTAAAARYDNARLRFEAARSQAQLARSRGQADVALAAKLDAGRARATMLRAQSNGLRAKAKQAQAAGNIDQANAYLDKADRLSKRASQISGIVSRMQSGAQAAPEAPVAPAAAAAAAAPEPPDAPAAPTAAAQGPQADDGENPFQARNAFKYRQRLPDQAARGGDRLRDVKKLTSDRDWDGAIEVLNRMEQKAQSGNFIQRGIAGVQAARARRNIRNEAGRVMKDGMESHANGVEGARMQVRLNHAQRIDKARELVDMGAMTVAQAKAELFAALRQDAAQLPKASQSAVIQAERVLTRLARAEQQHKAGPVRALASKLGGLVLGSASATLKSNVAQLQSRAKELAKRGPEGAMAAHLMIRHAKTVARSAADLGLNPDKVERKGQKIAKLAVRNLQKTINDARKGDPETVALSYNALEALRLDNPTPGLAEKIEKDMGNYDRDMREASMNALDQLSRYSEHLSKMKQPEAHAEAARVNSMALGVRDVLAANGVSVPNSISKRIDKTDAKVNGRDKFGYKLRHADGVIAKAGVVMAGAAKLIGKTVLLPVRIATFPIRLPFKIAKRIVKGNGMMEPADLERKMRGLQGFAGSYMPEQMQQQMEGGGGEEVPVAAQVPPGQGQMTPSPAYVNAMH